MDACRMEATAASVCSLEKQLTLILITALLTTLLTVTVIALAVGAVAACNKSLQKKRNICVSSLKSPIQENSKDREEMHMVASNSSHYAVQSDIADLSRKLASCTSIITTTAVQGVSTDNGELVVS